MACFKTAAKPAGSPTPLLPTRAKRVEARRSRVSTESGGYHLAITASASFVNQSSGLGLDSLSALRAISSSLFACANHAAESTPRRGLRVEPNACRAVCGARQNCYEVADLAHPLQKNWRRSPRSHPTAPRIFLRNRWIRHLECPGHRLRYTCAQQAVHSHSWPCASANSEHSTVRTSISAVSKRRFDVIEHVAFF
jgi:hypothetical protein